MGGTTDTVAGLTHLGAQEYDPGLGRFVSVDPLLDPSDPQQVDGYSYADANPVTNADPWGERAPTALTGCAGHHRASTSRPPAFPSKAVSARRSPRRRRWGTCRSRSRGSQRRAGSAAGPRRPGGPQVKPSSISSPRVASVSPDYGAGVADGVANAVYVPARMVVCQTMATACDDMGLPATVHIPLDGDTSSGGLQHRSACRIDVGCRRTSDSGLKSVRDCLGSQSLARRRVVRVVVRTDAS